MDNSAHHLHRTNSEGIFVLSSERQASQQSNSSIVSDNCQFKGGEKLAVRFKNQQHSCNKESFYYQIESFTTIDKKIQ